MDFLLLTSAKNPKNPAIRLRGALRRRSGHTPPAVAAMPMSMKMLYR